MAKILSVIAPEGYQDIEYGDSKVTLESRGHTVVTASHRPDVTGKFGGHATVDVLICKADPDDYDAILFVGGPGSHELFDDPDCHRLAQSFLKTGKPTTAICAASSILANAELLSGIHATCFPDQADNLKKHGALYTAAPVEKDGLIITADGPESAKEFGSAIADVLG